MLVNNQIQKIKDRNPKEAIQKEYMSYIASISDLQQKIDALEKKALFCLKKEKAIIES